MLSGGSAVYNELQGVSYTAEIWDPHTGQWTLVADEAMPRLYHSTTMLMADGTVLSLAGGAPGPVANLNGQTYQPGYLFDDNGNAAVRPVIVDAPGKVLPGQQFVMHVDNPAEVQTLALMGFGAVTHAFDMASNRIELAFTVQADGSLLVTLPPNSNVLTPGYWMLFAVTAEGTPSIAATMQVGTELLYDLPNQMPFNPARREYDFRAQRRRGLRFLQRHLCADAGRTEQDRQLHGAATRRSRASLRDHVPIQSGKQSRRRRWRRLCVHNDPDGAFAIGDTPTGQGMVGVQNGVGIAFASSNEAIDHSSFVNTATGAALSAIVNLANIEDGAWHRVHIVSDGVNISYTIDGVQIAALSIAEAQTLLGSRFAYFGFTGNTSAALEQTQIQILSVETTLESGQEFHIDRADLAQPVAFIANARPSIPARATLP